MTENVPAAAWRWIRSWQPAWPLLLLAAMAGLLAGLADWSSPALRYQRQEILAGEWWRLLSGHFVHLSASHLWLNVAGLGLVALLFGRGVSALRWWWLTGCSLAILGVGFLGFEPGLGWYVGLSGLLHGLIIGGAFLDLTFPCRERNILVLIVIGKLLWEQAYGVLPLTAEAAGGPVVVDAHLYGAIGGIVGVVLFWVREKVRSRV